MVTEDVAFALFFRPRPGGSIAQESLPPLEFAIQGKKSANARGSSRGGGGVGGWAQVELTDAFIQFGMCFSLRLLSYGDGDPSKPHLNLRGKHFLLLFCVICPCL